MEREDVALLLQLRQGDLFDILGSVVAEILVIGKYAASEPLQPTGKSGSHVAEPNDTHGTVTQLQATVGFATPDSLSHLGIGRGDMVEQCQQHSYGMLAHSVAIAFGRVEATDAQLLGIVDVDGLHTGT